MSINILIQQWNDDYYNHCLGLILNRKIVALRRFRGERREVIFNSHAHSSLPDETGKVILVENTFSPSTGWCYHELENNVFYSPTQCISATELSPWPKELLDKLTVVDLGTIGKFDYKLATERNEDKRRQLNPVFSNSSVAIDRIAPISIIYDQELINRFLENAPDSLNVIQLANPFRGGSGAGVAGAGETFKSLHKDTVVKTTCLFAYKAKFNTIVDWTLEDPVVEEKELTFLGMFISKESFLRYRRPSEFLVEFRNLAINNISKYLDYEAYQLELRKQLGKLGVYWTGLQEIAKESLDRTFVPVPPTNFQVLGLEELSPLLFASALQSVPEINEYNCFVQVIKQQQEEANRVRSEINFFESDKRGYERDVQDYLDAIESRKRVIKETIKNIEDRNLKATGIESAIPEMLEELNKKKIIADEKRVDQEPFIQKQTNKIIKTLEETYKIRLTKLKIKDKKTNKIYEISLNSKLDAILDFSIEEIEFITLQPSLIYVDRNADKQRDIRVGGPYRIRWQKNYYLSIKLLDMYSVFGIQDKDIKCHPHSSAKFISHKTFDEIKQYLIDNWSDCCWGEAAVPTNKAMEAGNLKLTILNILNWVNNANSADTWGANFTWFPKPDQINFNPDWDNIQIPEPSIKVTTEDNMEDLIAQAIEALDDNTGGV